MKGYIMENVIKQEIKTNELNVKDSVTKIVNIKEHMKALKKELESLENGIKLYLKDNKLDYINNDEVSIELKHITTKRFDTKAFQVEHAETYEKYLYPSSYTKLTTKLLK